jgi:hypothetical protein
VGKFSNRKPARCLNPCLWLFWAVWLLINAGMAAALLVHALDEQAKTFYLGHGFIESPIEPMTLMLNLAQTAALTLDSCAAVRLRLY